MPLLLPQLGIPMDAVGIVTLSTSGHPGLSFDDSGSVSGFLNLEDILRGKELVWGVAASGFMIGMVALGVVAMVVRGHRARRAAL